MSTPDHTSNDSKTPADEVASYRARLVQLMRTVDRGHGRDAASLPSPATFLLEETVAKLQTVEGELRAQSDALMEAHMSVEARGLEFQLLFEYAPVAYLVTDPYGLVRDANVTATRLLHRAKNALIGKPLAVFVPPGMRQAFRAAINYACAGGEPEEWPMRLRPPGGDPVDVVFTIAAAPGHATGRAALYWLVRHDVRRDVEDLL